MLAPNHVSAPAAIHTSSMPPKLGTARLTSDGCTKIDAADDRADDHRDGLHEADRSCEFHKSLKSEV